MKSIKPLTIKVLLPFLAFLLLFSCSSKVKKESFDVGLKSKILIASDQSEYKDRLRDMLIKRYIKNFNIDIINISDLNEVDEKSYGVILIIDTCMAWSTFNPS